MRLNGIVVLLMSLTAVGQDRSEKLQTFRGVLLDGPCASSIGVDSRLDQTKQKPPETIASTGSQEAPKPTGTADREATPRLDTRDDLVPCQASITSTSFAIRADGGRTLRFDTTSNGNLVVKIQGDDQWKAALSANQSSPNSDKAPPSSVKAVSVSAPKQPRRVEVQGRITGDELSVQNVRLDPSVPAADRQR